ncbi:MAG: hypothetical protein FK733_11920 [Asgard group archaeon]|nr:hypothetical protein [Asgard group archaeon]
MARKMTYKFNRLLLLFALLFSSLIVIEKVIADDPPEPEEFDYILPGQTWTFLNISTLEVNQTADFEWRTNQTVRGREVTKEQFETMQVMSISELVAYFESIGFTDGRFDSGRTETGLGGNLYFVFYNYEISSASIHITISYLNSIFQPWIIGVITSAIVVVLLAILIYVTMRMSKKVLKQQEEEEKSPAQRYLEM